MFRLLPLLAFRGRTLAPNSEVMYSSFIRYLGRLISPNGWPLFTSPIPHPSSHRASRMEFCAGELIGPDVVIDHMILGSHHQRSDIPVVFLPYSFIFPGYDVLEDPPQ